MKENLNTISFKISREMLMEMSALKSPEDGFQYIEDCFAIDKNRIEEVTTIWEPSMEPLLNITIKPVSVDTLLNTIEK
jgi:hypothetical protein